MLHNNKELFEQAILRTSEAFGIEASIVEKDYFVTLFLKEISKILPAIIFKGGTSLSKCHKIIKRFSEDIDLNIECESKPTQGQRKGLKANVVSAIENLGLELANPDEIKSNMEYNKYVVDFPSVFKFDALKPHLIVETALLIRSYPTEKMQASSFIYDYFSQNGFDELIEEYALSPFETGVFFMLNIAVCDDNIYFGKRMVENIRAICAKILPERLECTVIPAFCSADEVLEYLKGNNINVIFLDIDMPGHSGFELAAILNEISPGIEIVFVSSHNDLVYSSFEYRPFCFIRKTHLDGELPDTLSKLINEYMSMKETCTFSSTEGDIMISVKDIYYIESQKNYFILCLAGGQECRCRGTIAEVESRLAKFDFCRIHAGYIINLENIDRVMSTTSVLMKNGAVLKISQRRSQFFKDKYMIFTRKRVAKW